MINMRRMIREDNKPEDKRKHIIENITGNISTVEFEWNGNTQTFIVYKVDARDTMARSGEIRFQKLFSTVRVSISRHHRGYDFTQADKTKVFVRDNGNTIEYFNAIVTDIEFDDDVQYLTIRAIAKKTY